MCSVFVCTCVCVCVCVCVRACVRVCVCVCLVYMSGKYDCSHMHGYKRLIPFIICGFYSQNKQLYFDM